MDVTNEQIDVLARAYLGDCGPQASRVYNFARAILALATSPAPSVQPAAQEAELRAAAKDVLDRLDAVFPDAGEYEPIVRLRAALATSPAQSEGGAHLADVLRMHIRTLQASGRSDGMTEDMERAAVALAPQTDSQSEGEACSVCRGIGQVGTPGAACPWCKGTGKDSSAPQSAAPAAPGASRTLSGITDDDLSRLLPNSWYMDPPDGGSVTLLEQLQRMTKDADKWRAHEAGGGAAPGASPEPLLPVPYPKREDVSDVMRARFERLFADEQGRNHSTLRRNEQGAYANLRVAADWTFYQRAWADALEAAAPGASEGVTHEQIRATLLAHGFTIKEGQTDLKPYVYEAARALLALAPPAPSAQTAAQEAMKVGEIIDNYVTARERVEGVDALLNDEGLKLPVGTDLYALATPPAAQTDSPDDGRPIREGWQVTVADGHAGFGAYAHLTEYPDEGAIFLAAPVASEGVTDEQIEERMQRLGARWDGDHWLIEDADLHPLYRTIAAPPAPSVQTRLHPRTADLVRRFTAALAEKLAAAERKYGYSDGWASPEWMDECRAQLAEHVRKGDPRDVAAYCAFLWHHGESTAAQTDSQSEEADSIEAVADAARRAYFAGESIYEFKKIAPESQEKWKAAARAVLAARQQEKRS